LKDSTHAYEVARAHEHATSSFSLVTVVFHAFFLMWICLPVLNNAPLIFAPLLGLAFLLTVFFGDRVAIWVAFAAFSVGAATMLLGVQRQELPYVYAVVDERASKDLTSLASVCTFGFALCPYLDRTFLHARQRTTVVGGRASFALGFGGFFLAMIILTLMYSGWMHKFLHSTVVFPAYVWPLIGLHLAGQSLYTTGLHWRRVREEGLSSWIATAFVAISITLLIVIFRVRPWLPYWCALPYSGEYIYRFFMSLYGLVFPAYVWLCMIPGRGRVKPHARALVVFAVAVILAAPTYWMAFMEGKMIWVLPGLAVVLLARLFIRGVGVPPARDGYQRGQDAHAMSGH
jgi:hypothetical protein